MNPKQKRAAALAAAQAIVEGAKASVRAMTADEKSQVETYLAEVDQLDVQIKGAGEDEARLARLAELTPEAKSGRNDEDHKDSARTLGEHFAKSVGAKGFADLKAIGGFTVSSPEWVKAATDPQLTTGAPFGLMLTEVDRTIVHGNRPGPVVADLLGSGTLAGNAITYFVEGALEGDFTTVAQGGAKPQFHNADPAPVTDALKKIAGWWDTSDEMVEDLPFMVSEINNRGLYRLSMVEENQLVSGLGTGSTVQGLLLRAGIQTEVQAIAPDSAQDALFRAITKVQTATGMAADGIIIHPTDYQKLRLSKDANGQYFGGGFFSGQYGAGGIISQPPLWGLTTVVTTAVAVGTAIVGAFKQAATVYRKGGVRVESTNSDLGKFTTNIITTRIEERVALAVRIPLAIVKVTLL
ncbi:MAG: phage major capsid protein [Rhodoglobus sp.]